MNIFNNMLTKTSGLLDNILPIIRRALILYVIFNLVLIACTFYKIHHIQSGLRIEHSIPNNNLSK